MIELNDLSMTLKNGLDIDGLEFEVEVTSYVNEPKVIHLAPEDCTPGYFEIEYKILTETIEYCGDDGEQVSAPELEDEIIDAFDSKIEDAIINWNAD